MADNDDTRLMLEEMLHSSAARLKNSYFVAHASAIEAPEDAALTRAALTGDPSSAFRGAACSMAYRVAPLEGDEGSDDGGESVGDGDGVDEGFVDGDDVGAGSKLLALLQRWDVMNVVLCVTRVDRGHLAEVGALGVRRYRIVLGCAKDVLEKCYTADAPPPSAPPAAAVRVGTATPPPVQVPPARMERSAAAESARLGSLEVALKRGDASGKFVAPLKLTSSLAAAGTRQPLPLAQSALNEAAQFPVGHKPSVMASKIGVKRGQVNNFRDGRGGAPPTLQAARAAAANRNAPLDQRYLSFDAARFRPQPPPPQLGPKPMRELASMHHPAAEVARVFACTTALAYNCGLPGWVDVREAIMQKNYLALCRGVDAVSLDPAVVEAVRDVLGAELADIELVRRKSVVAGGFLMWVRQTVSHFDECVRIAAAQGVGDLGGSPSPNGFGSPSPDVLVLDGEGAVGEEWAGNSSGRQRIGNRMSLEVPKPLVGLGDDPGSRASTAGGGMPVSR